MLLPFASPLPRGVVPPWEFIKARAEYNVLIGCELGWNQSQTLNEQWADLLCSSSDASPRRLWLDRLGYLATEVRWESRQSHLNPKELEIPPLEGLASLENFIWSP